MTAAEGTTAAETGNVLGPGASGRSGSHAARAFAAAGREHRRFDRRRDDAAAAARGADVIVNVLNPPGCRGCDRAEPAITRLALAAAASGATPIVPGDVHVQGREPGPRPAATPRRPATAKRRIRVATDAPWPRPRRMARRG